MATHLLGGEKNYTVSALSGIPTSGLKVGDRAFITDATSGFAFGGTSSGGGSFVVPVYWNGTAWVNG